MKQIPLFIIVLLALVILIGASNYVSVAQKDASDTEAMQQYNEQWQKDIVESQKKILKELQAIRSSQATMMEDLRFIRSTQHP